ncbi:uracil-DNA glycosylase [Sutcliffiella horikoshii]|uniref:Uracil-DNA glycosylase n=1 Tax=Sutcliffiella horikoshii TaxID=79883 RepID=A0A5D4T4A4_9BACI|nr:uracil-DNA glycosylase [Sutcliffiella horikoshii]TYS70119.1 uracil-DNA glycosylase [Sutcliffiella horikoshii]
MNGGKTVENVSGTWKALLEKEVSQKYFKDLMDFLEVEYANKTVYPEKKAVFSAFQATRFEDVKVVILGQDPYHGKGQAHGMSFSVQKGVRVPPSLKNIYRELYDDQGLEPVNHGFLMEWAKQGVLLLNTVLTVRESNPNSHKGMGWELFTDEVIRALNERQKPVIFILWGKHAEQKEALITNDYHFILKSPHPSPFSARKGFFGSRPFSKVNAILEEIGEEAIDWRLTP